MERGGSCRAKEGLEEKSSMETSSHPAASTATVVEKELLVDPFLVKAVQDTRHRLTILRMGLDIQRFLQSSDQQQFEFQYFPTSYLRLAAHRVAQHYGLVTVVHDNGVDGMMNKIVVKKTMERRYPVICLSEIPVKQSEIEKPEQLSIVTHVVT
ncbi:hypothetical protein K2173_009173 [Erythroxylum novogranatense]|uniref:R3H domain-containing protein n=1 Tax=Erythroxylum novogranatense TaxID=1862640 RepID=A0AAV8TDK5_9ROSI|nr:hypothetical protein K2173_009173 [Erythroxylum novogranatense]